MGGIPVSSPAGVTTNLSTWGSWSAHSIMLPYIEQSAIYNAINFKTPSIQASGTGAEGNSTAVLTKINAFLCPSSPPYPGISYPVSGGGNGPSPGNNYFASAGSSMNVFAGGANPGFGTYASTAAAPNGPFQVGGQVFAERDITDGLSNTIAFGEWRAGDNNSAKFSSPQEIILGSAPTGASLYDNTGALLTEPQGSAVLSQFLTACTGLAQPAGTVPNHLSFIGELWAEGVPARSMGNTLQAPNPQYPNCVVNGGGGDTDNDYGVVGMSSYHPGGANVAFCDGSVHFLKNTTNQLTVWQLGSRSQGEVISADAY